MVHVKGKDDSMVANNLEPHYLTHPGEVIKDELEFRGISQRRLAAEIGVPASQLNEVLNAKRPLSAEMALLIEQALGLDAAPLLTLQMEYNLLSAKRNKSFLERLKDIPRIAAVFPSIYNHLSRWFYCVYLIIKHLISFPKSFTTLKFHRWFICKIHSCINSCKS